MYTPPEILISNFFAAAAAISARLRSERKWDSEAFQELYELVKGPVYGYSLSILKNHEEAMKFIISNEDENSAYYSKRLTDLNNFYNIYSKLYKNYNKKTLWKERFY